MEYKCNKCGVVVKEIPKGHGYFTMAIYPEKAKHKKCKGEFKLSV